MLIVSVSSLNGIGLRAILAPDEWPAERQLAGVILTDCTQRHEHDYVGLVSCLSLL